jgi:hypothetical protein
MNVLTTFPSIANQTQVPPVVGLRFGMVPRAGAKVVGRQGGKGIPSHRRPRCSKPGAPARSEPSSPT